MNNELSSFIDKNGVVLSWPAKYNKKVKIIYYLSSKFEADKVYDEQDVNLILRKWSNYTDYPLLRRALVDLGLLNRDSYGKEYTLTQKAIKENQVQ